MMATSRRTRRTTPQVEALEGIISLSAFAGEGFRNLGDLPNPRLAFPTGPPRLAFPTGPNGGPNQPSPPPISPHINVFDVKVFGNDAGAPIEDNVLYLGTHNRYTMYWNISGCEQGNCSVSVDTYNHFWPGVTVHSSHYDNLKPSGTLTLDTQPPNSLMDSKQVVITVTKTGSNSDSRSVKLDVHNPPTKSDTHDTTYPFYLDRQQVSEGLIPYTGVFGQGIHGNLRSITNPNPFPVRLPRPGYPTSEYYTNPKAVVILNPGGSTTSQDLTSIYGSSSPAVPISILAVIDNGTAIPDRLRLDISYVY